MSASALVSCEWLATRLGDPRVGIIESSVEKRTYDAAHIPGALWVDAHRDLLHRGDDSSGHVLSPEEFSTLMERIGITPETTVVWYGDRHSSFAIRGFWTLDYFGHAGGNHVLAGGREGWLAEHRPTTAEVTRARPAAYPVPTRSSDANRSTWQETLAAIDDPQSVLLDVRSRGEFDGSEARAARAGHIPGAVHIDWTDATSAPNVLKSKAELRALYEAHGVTSDHDVITYCQLGIRAAHTWFVLKHVLGYPRVRNYAGSWQEWATEKTCLS